MSPNNGRAFGLLVTARTVKRLNNNLMAIIALAFYNSSMKSCFLNCRSQNKNLADFSIKIEPDIYAAFCCTQKMQFVPQMKILDFIKNHKNEAR